MMLGSYPSMVVRVVSAVLVPFMLMFGVYIIAHGHYGPGGGFAGGVFLAVGAILPRLTLPQEIAYRVFPAWLGPLVGGGGMLLFLLVAAAPMVAGGAFLDYGAIEVAGVEASRVRYLGILIVEVAVGLAVFGAMVLIFDVINGTEPHPSEPAPGPAGGSDTTPAPAGGPDSTPAPAGGCDSTQRPPGGAGSSQGGPR